MFATFSIWESQACGIWSDLILWSFTGSCRSHGAYYRMNMCNSRLLDSQKLYYNTLFKQRNKVVSILCYTILCSSFSVSSLEDTPRHFPKISICVTLTEAYYSGMLYPVIIMLFNAQVFLHSVITFIEKKRVIYKRKVYVPKSRLFLHWFTISIPPSLLLNGTNL